MVERAHEQMVLADDGHELWVRDAGTPTAPAMICCHGGPGVGDYLRAIEEMFADQFRVIRWDQRGSGRSQPGGPFTIDRFVLDLDCVRAALGIDTYILFGHSWGANLAIHYAQAYPDLLRAIVHVSGTGLEWWPTYTAMHKQRQVERLGDELGAELQRLRSMQPGERSPADEKLLRLLYIQSEQHDVHDRTNAKAIASDEASLPGSKEANATLNAECRALDLSLLQQRCRAITCPVLIVHGASDPRPLAALDSLIAALPNCEIELIDAAGHAPWAEQPGTFTAQVQSFLAALGPPE